MADTERQRQYRGDARVLGKIGWALVSSELPRVEVRIQRPLGEAAVAAWERDDEGPPEPEDYEQRAQRHRAATLALIGLAIVGNGKWDTDEVVVPGVAGSRPLFALDGSSRPRPSDPEQQGSYS